MFNYEILEKSWNTAEVINVFQQTLSKLYGEFWIEKSKTKLKLFVTDGGSQMVCAGKQLKKSYPDMLYLICFCHNLNNLCESIMSLFPNTLNFITALNNVLYSSTERMRTFMRMFNVTTRPVKYVPTRWGTGLDAVQYWHYNFIFAFNYLNTLPEKSSDSDYLNLARNLVKNELTKNELEFLHENYCFISKIIHKLEQRNQSMETSINLIESIKNGLNKQSNNEKGKIIIERFDEIFNKNPGFKTLMDSKPNFGSLQFAPPGSYEAERANKMFKSSYTNDRIGMKIENVKIWSYIRFNSIALGMREVKVRNSQDSSRLQLQKTATQKLSFLSLFINEPLINTVCNFEDFSIEELDEQLNVELEKFDNDDFTDDDLDI